MKTYNNFRWGRNNPFLLNTLLLVFSLLLITESLQAQTTVITPCSCSSFNIIGATNEETSMEEYVNENGELNPERCYLVKGTLVIDTGTWWVNLRIKMEEKAKIRVEEVLSIDNCYLSGCGDMWQGVETVGQTDFHSYRSYIEDANIGVKLGGVSWLRV